MWTFIAGATTKTSASSVSEIWCTRASDSSQRSTATLHYMAADAEAEGVVVKHTEDEIAPRPAR
jgi:hypothetical protein